MTFVKLSFSLILFSSDFIVYIYIYIYIYIYGDKNSPTWIGAKYS